MLNLTPSYRLMPKWVCLLQIFAKKCWLSCSDQLPGNSQTCGFKATHQFLEKLCNLFLQTEKPEKLALLTALERTPRWGFFVVVFFKATCLLWQYLNFKTVRIAPDEHWCLGKQNKTKQKHKRVWHQNSEKNLAIISEDTVLFGPTTRRSFKN